MKEEFHWEEGKGYQQLYGWSSLHASVWLPSLIELVGFDPNSYNDTRGCYLSAMQGLNTSDRYYTDAQGGNQFAYFEQYITNGGGEKLWTACKQQQSWLRSPHAEVNRYSWIMSGLNRFNAYEMYPLTGSYAVHPAVGDGKAATFIVL